MKYKRLVLRFLTVLMVSGRNLGLAMSYCSNSFRFDQLCPDPRFGSRESGAAGGGISGSSHLSTDTFIYLNTDNYRNRGRGGGSYSYSSTATGYGGRSYTSSMSVKDPSTTSCDFHRNGVETAVVNLIHISENPWNFRHANQCNHIVKLNYDLFDASSLATGSSGVAGAQIRKSVCQNEIGFRRQGSQDIDFRQAGSEKQDIRQSHSYDEEVRKKMNVYFWHNFTLYPHSAEFVDTITNYHWSKEDIICVNEKRNAQYVQIAVVVSKSGRCEIIVQQYKIEEKRSPWGCSGAGHPIPYPIQFCGSYDCSQSTGILTSLKLHPRRDSEVVDTVPTRSNQFGGKGGSFQQQRNSSGSISPHHSDYAEGTHTYPDYEGGEGGAGGPPCVTDMTETTTPGSITHLHSSSADSSEEEEEKEEPVDWMEALFLFAFPTGGVLLIILVLNFLRSQNTREICRGYTYPRPRRHLEDIHIGSFTSIDKNGLPI